MKPLLSSLWLMELKKFEQLKEKVEQLIRSNRFLKEEKRQFAEKLLLRERQIQELKERCGRYERSRQETYQRIDAILKKIDGIRS